MHEWDGIYCQICYRPYTAQSWASRHTIPAWHRQAGEDCHARCCPHPDCRAERATPKVKP